MRIFTAVVFFILVCDCFFSDLRCFAQRIPPDEVKALDAIATKLHYPNWRSNQSSCINNNFPLVKIGVATSNITCKCTLDTCRITNIQLKGLNLNGVFPPDFVSLRDLEEIDLTRNYISGPIPAAFGQFKKLKILSLLGNRLNGSIPSQISTINTLEELVLENNQFEGPLTESLGSLSSLRRLLLSGNNFTGQIPTTFANLTNLEDFRIDGNQLSGKIPEWIGSWANMERFYMQGASLEGPIPSTIKKLKNLTELVISDLRGPKSRFPDLQNMKNMEKLILRNCLINDAIPSFLTEMTLLENLDLSFNLLTGPVPGNILAPSKLKFLSLSNNLLTGTPPSREGKKIDFSNNNFASTHPYTCGDSPENLVSSLSSSVAGNLVQWCVKKDLPCPRKPRYHSLFINCGGGRTSFEGNEYEADTAVGEGSYFHSAEEKWAFSSTGLFLNGERPIYTTLNTSNLDANDAPIYQTARLSPTSLKYYGLCLRKGSYKVRLHFAELMFSNDKTFRSLGRRIFDVSIQGKVVRKNFNIAEQAKGVSKGTVLDFNDIYVNGSTLEIHLYWAGKGTNAIPFRTVHGPSISAITVTPNFKVDSGLSVGAIVGIVAASCVVVILILVVLRLKGYLGGNAEDKELRALELATGYFSLRQIKAATKNFDAAYKIGEGGFGPVYKGVLSDGTIIAVKQLSAKSKQGNREFINEIGMISALQHPNLVKLYGCCIEGNQLLLIYEYLENNSLARALFGQEEQRLNLDWLTRKKICLGIARGLAYLHEESRLKIVHRDIKATNVLLDKDLNAKISDFGLAKLDEEENTHISTRIAGTIGYMAPEYAMRGYLTDKADVYSFGVVILEIVSGKSNTNYRPKEEFVYLLDWAYVLHDQGNLLELVDPNLGTDYNKEEAVRTLNLALLCTNPSPTLRPSMSSVVSMLEGKIAVQPPAIRCRDSSDDMRFRAFEILSHDSQTQISTSSQDSRVPNDMSRGGPWIDSSVYSESKDETVSNCSTNKLLADH